MSVSDEAVQTSSHAIVLEVVEAQCDIGRAWSIDQGGVDEPSCPNHADWAALAHDCHLGRPILLCTKHLAMCREDQNPGQFIKWSCPRCKQITCSADELVWNVSRLA